MLARCVTGNQREMTTEEFGNTPASPAPKQNRASSRSGKLDTIPVREVNADHHNTIRVNTRRGPIRSPSVPLGISNRQ